MKITVGKIKKRKMFFMFRQHLFLIWEAKKLFT